MKITRKQKRFWQITPKQLSATITANHLRNDPEPSPKNGEKTTPARPKTQLLVFKTAKNAS